jgi:tetratricopeptide (TPR) repeat protein
VLLLARVLLAASETKAAETALLKVIELQPESPIGYFLLARHYLNTKEEDKALANFQQAAAKNPNSVEPLMLMAVMQDQRKDYEAARANYEKVLAINPKFSAALNNLAYLYAERLNNLDRAYALAQQARTQLPSEPNIADTLGWILYRRGEYPYALTLLGESAEKLPNTPDVHYHLGMTYYMLGEEASARAALERAIGINTEFGGADLAQRALSILNVDPAAAASPATITMLEQASASRPDPIALARLGAIHERAGALPKAVSAFESALKASPNNVSAMLNLIRLLVLDNKRPQAFEMAKTAYKIAPGNTGVTHALGRLAYDSGDRTWGASLLLETSRKLPDDPTVLFDSGEASYSVGQVQNSEAAIRQALQVNPLFPRAAQARTFLEMIDLSTDGARARAAVGKIDQVLATSPMTLPAMMAKAAALEQQPDLPAARDAYEKALAQFPEFTPAKRRLAILYARGTGNDPKAADMANQARAAFPNDPEIAKALGIITYRQGAYPRALNLLQESARQRTSDAEVQFYLGMTQHQLKNLTASAQALQRALELGLRGEQETEARRILAGSG